MGMGIDVLIDKAKMGLPPPPYYDTFEHMRHRISPRKMKMSNIYDMEMGMFVFSLGFLWWNLNGLV